MYRSVEAAQIGRPQEDHDIEIVPREEPVPQRVTIPERVPATAPERVPERAPVKQP